MSCRDDESICLVYIIKIRTSSYCAGYHANLHPPLLRLFLVTMQLSRLIITASIPVVIADIAPDSHPIVDLGYVKYRGSYNDTSGHVPLILSACGVC